MKFVDKFSVEDTKRDVVEENYNKLGQQADKNEKVFAKFVDIDIGNDQSQKKFLILTHNNVPYDPNGVDSHRELWLRTELKAVSKQTFDYYLMYLQTKNSLYMTRTQRSFING